MVPLNLRFFRSWSFPLFLVLLLSGCSNKDPIAGAVSSLPTDSIGSSRPIADMDTLHGMDLSRLRKLVADIRLNEMYPDIHSLLITRYGKMVMEEYFHDHTAEDLHTLQSVTKSFTSAIIGVAVEEGFINGVNEKIVDFFPQWKDSLVLDPRRAAMQLEHVLTMRTGTDYHEGGADSPHAQLNSLPSGWDRFWLDRPMVTDPGTFWRYDSGGVVALSSMLKNRTGKHADGYMEDVLFSSLDITNVSWARNSEGHPHTGGGLRLRPRDMVKFGQLFLQKGKWGGTQVIPEWWVEESIKPRHTFNPPRGSAGKTTGYGYLWWLLSPDPGGAGQEEIYAAMGYRSQYIFVVPEHEMVVAVAGWMPPAESWKPIGFLYSDILPAVIR